MKNPALPLLTSLAGVFVCSLFIGCAVTTIDVDVYKGPLSNDEDVQMEQTAAMAIGAKPLLVQLRDELQWAPGEPRPKEYLADFMPGYVWKRPEAERANVVLSLYQDRTEAQLATLLSQGRQQVNAYQSAYKSFRESTSVENADALQWWPDEAGRVRNGELPATETDPIKGGLGLMRYGYAMMFCRTGTYDPRKRYEQYIFWGHTLLKQRNVPVPLQKGASLPSLKAFLHTQDVLSATDPFDSELIPANKAFELLSDRKFVELHADLLFPHDDAADAASRAAFITRVASIAPQFHRARRALSDLFHTALQIMVYVDLHPRKDGSQPVRLRHLADWIAKLMDPRATGFAYAGASQQSPLSEEASILVGRLKKKLGRFTDQDFELSHAAATTALLTAVADELVAHPSVSAIGLDQWNRAFIESSYPVQTPREMAFREFGLVRGPTAPDVSDVNVEKDWSESTRDMKAVGFETGRLDLGVNSLTEIYLKAAYVAKAGDDSLKRQAEVARGQLLDQLVQFSEKVLYLANNAVLLEHDTSDYGSSEFDTESQSQHSRHRDYAHILQAVGNSILVQVDELRHREKYKQSDIDRAKPEKEGMNGVDRALSTGPTSRPSGSDLAEMGNDTRPTGANRREVMDALIAKLKYEYVQVVRVNGSDDPRAKHILDALDFLYHKRADAVYIRPPISFLRNSYPVTSLQSTSQGQWTNELSRQAARGAPFAELIRDGIYPEAHHDAKVQAEIDKQFWQNINRIRVAGAGRTNYVMAKDDVGNWYVKGYSADPRDIIETARAMAGFAIGTPVSTASIEAELQGKKPVDQQGNFVANSFSGAASQNPANKPSTSRPSAAEQRTQNTALHNFQSRQRADVDSAFKDRLTRLNSRLDPEALSQRLRQAVMSAWAAAKIDSGESSTALNAAETELAKKLGDLNKPASTLPELEKQVTSKLQVAADFRSTLFAQLYKGAPDAVASAKKAVGAATQAVSSATQATTASTRAADSAIAAATQASDAASFAEKAVTGAVGAAKKAAAAADDATSAADEAVTAAQAGGAGPGATHATSAVTHANAARSSAAAASAGADSANGPATQATAAAKEAKAHADDAKQQAGDAKKAGDAATTQAADAHKDLKQADDLLKNATVPATKASSSDSKTAVANTGNSGAASKTGSTAATTPSDATDTVVTTQPAEEHVAKHIAQISPQGTVVYRDESVIDRRGPGTVSTSSPKRQGPTVQPSQPDTPADPKGQAFRVAAEALRDAISPLVNDALDASRSYQAQLHLIQNP